MHICTHVRVYVYTRCIMCKYDSYGIRARILYNNNSVVYYVERSEDQPAFKRTYSGIA